MAEHMNQEVTHLPEGWSNMGKPIPPEVRQYAYDQCKEMGLEGGKAWAAVSGVAEQLERDKPYEAQATGMKYLDLTGTYRLMAALLTGPAPSKPQYTCPKCGGHKFEIEVTNIATVEFKPDEDHEVEEITDEAQWDETAKATCSNEDCMHTDTIKAMETPHEGT